MNSYEYRKGNRTDDEFKKDISTRQELEEKYVKDFINSYHDRSKHKRWIYFSWGNRIKTIDKKDKYNYIWNNPDFLLMKTFDDSSKGRYILPLEVDGASYEGIKYGIAEHKIKHYLNKFYDENIESIISKKCHILYVINKNNPGKEKFCILTDKDLEEISKTKPELSSKGRMCYWFYHKDFEWKSFNGRTKQTNL